LPQSFVRCYLISWLFAALHAANKTPALSCRIALSARKAGGEKGLRVCRGEVFAALTRRGTAQDLVVTCSLYNAKGIRPMGRGLLLWLIGIPLPIILLIWLFGGLHG
jgi:hypothetical protein